MPPSSASAPMRPGSSRATVSPIRRSASSSRACVAGVAGLVDRAAGPARRRPDAADGDARHVADARRTRQPQRLADRRRRRPQLHDRAGARPVPDRLHRPAQRRALQLRRAVRAVRPRAAAARSRPSACRCGRSARTGCAPARSASPTTGGSSRSMASPRPTPAPRARCWRRRRRSCRSTCSTSTAPPTSC